LNTDHMQLSPELVSAFFHGLVAGCCEAAKLALADLKPLSRSSAGPSPKRGAKESTLRGNGSAKQEVQKAGKSRRAGSPEARRSPESIVAANVKTWKSRRMDLQKQTAGSAEAKDVKKPLALQGRSELDNDKEVSKPQISQLSGIQSSLYKTDATLMGLQKTSATAIEAVEARLKNIEQLWALEGKNMLEKDILILQSQMSGMQTYCEDRFRNVDVQMNSFNSQSLERHALDSTIIIQQPGIQLSLRDSSQQSSLSLQKTPASAVEEVNARLSSIEEPWALERQNMFENDIHILQSQMSSMQTYCEAQFKSVEVQMNSFNQEALERDARSFVALHDMKDICIPVCESVRSRLESIEASPALLGSDALENNMRVLQFQVLGIQKDCGAQFKTLHGQVSAFSTHSPEPERDAKSIRLEVFQSQILEMLEARFGAIEAVVEEKLATADTKQLSGSETERLSIEFSSHAQDLVELSTLCSELQQQVIAFENGPSRASEMERLSSGFDLFSQALQQNNEHISELFALCQDLQPQGLQENNENISELFALCRALQDHLQDLQHQVATGPVVDHGHHRAAEMERLLTDSADQGHHTASEIERLSQCFSSQAQVSQQNDDKIVELSTLCLQLQRQVATSALAPGQSKLSPNHTGVDIDARLVALEMQVQQNDNKCSEFIKSQESQQQLSILHDALEGDKCRADGELEIRLLALGGQVSQNEDRLTQMVMQCQLLQQQVASGPNEMQAIALDSARMELELNAQVAALAAQMQQNEDKCFRSVQWQEQQQGASGAFSSVFSTDGENQGNVDDGLEARFESMYAKIMEVESKQCDLLKHSDSRLKSLWEHADAIFSKVERFELALPMTTSFDAESDSSTPAPRRSQSEYTLPRSAPLLGFGTWLGEERTTPESSGSSLGTQVADIRSSFRRTLTKVGALETEVTELADFLPKVLGPMPLAVTIHNIAGLRSPYPRLWCIGEILGKPGSVFETSAASTSSGELHAEWNETHEFAEFGFNDNLQLRVYDKNEWPMQDTFLGEVTLLGKDIYTGSHGDMAKLTNGLPGVHLHFGIVGLKFTHQQAEIRQVTTLVGDVRTMVTDALSMIDARSKSHVDSDAVLSSAALSDELAEYKGLFHKFEQESHPRIRVLELATGDLVTKIRLLEKKLGAP